MLADCSIEQMNADTVYDLADFDCAEPVYNDYLHRRAQAAVEGGAAAVYLLVADQPDGDRRILGYWAMCPHAVARDEAARKWTTDHRHNPVSAWLIGQLALGKDLRGQRVPEEMYTWGQVLMRAALSRVVAAAEYGGGALIVLDADNEKLISYYEQYDFEPAKRDAKGRPLGLRMMMKTATARAAL